MNRRPNTAVTVTELRRRAESRLLAQSRHMQEQLRHLPHHMRERMEMVGGDHTVGSAPDQGATIRAQIPFRSSPAPGGELADGVR